MKAKLHVTVVEFTCPKCNEFISNPDTGSHMFGLNDSMPEKLECPDCKIELEFPKSLKRLKENHG